MTQKISEWLNDYGSHDIYTAKFVAEDFEKCTGQKWPKYIRTFSTQETRDTIEARGLGVVLEECRTTRALFGVMRWRKILPETWRTLLRQRWGAVQLCAVVLRR